MRSALFLLIISILAIGVGLVIYGRNYQLTISQFKKECFKSRGHIRSYPDTVVCDMKNGKVYYYHK